MKSRILLLCLVTVFLNDPCLSYNGFKILKFEKGSVYDQLGLKEGDIIKSFNGKPLRSQKDAMTLFDGFKNEHTIDLDLERNGKPLTLHYNIVQDK